MSEQQQNRLLYQLLGSLCNDTITPEEHDQLQEVLTHDAEARQIYFQYLDLHLGLEQLHGVDTPAPLERTEEHATQNRLLQRSLTSKSTAKYFYAMVTVASLVVMVVAVGLLLHFQNRTQLTAENNIFASVTQTSQVRFANGSPVLRVGSQLQRHQEYALVEGELQIIFVNGAEVILKGPAVFEVHGRESLNVDYGACSVYAPAGAEGFVVKTPLSRVVDLGTRFSIDVNESGETDVQVVEGEAEVNPAGSKERTKQQTTRLTEGMAKRYTHDHKMVAQNIQYDQTRYTKRLSDRVIGYTATPGKYGGVENLTGVTVQRGGEKINYAVDQLIGIEVIHFKGLPLGGGHLTVGIDSTPPAPGSKSLAFRRGLLDADVSLTTGLINPGGAEQPLETDPVINTPELKGHPNTPGIAIRFKSPVVNAPGPDVILFDLHVIVHPVHGDQFHILPLHFRPGLHAHTIRKFDINLSSAEALMIDKFKLFSFKSNVGDLDQLESFKHNGGTLHVVRAKALATGIDLSDLGYKEGEKVDSLFIQDALGNSGHLDPVFIAGLPHTLVK